MYSMPPFSLERKGLGELDNAILGGFFMKLISYTAQTGMITINSILSLIPIFLAVLVNLLGVHWSDRIADESVGKLTLVVKLVSKTRFLFYFLVFLTYFITILLMGRVLPNIVAIAILITLPFGIYCSYKFTKTSSPMISSVFMAVVMSSMIFSYIFGWLEIFYNSLIVFSSNFNFFWEKIIFKLLLNVFLMLHYLQLLFYRKFHFFAIDKRSLLQILRIVESQSV